MALAWLGFCPRGGEEEEEEILNHKSFFFCYVK
jgi:hypothetical protein